MTESDYDRLVAKMDALQADFADLISVIDERHILTVDLIKLMADLGERLTLLEGNQPSV